MNSKHKPQKGDPCVQRALALLDCLPPKARIAALTEVKGILCEFRKANEQLRNTGSSPNLKNLLLSGSKELRRLAHSTAKHRSLEWARSHIEEQIELHEGRAQMERLEKSFRDLESAMADPLTFGAKLKEFDCALGEEPTVLKAAQQNSNGKEAIEAMETIVTTYHKARRRLMSPRRLLWRAYCFEINMWARSFARGVTTLLAGMAIFLLAGLAHRLHTIKWWAVFIAVPLAVAAVELLAHRWVESRLHKWERHDMDVLIQVLAKSRVEVVIDNALAEWAINPRLNHGDASPK